MATSADAQPGHGRLAKKIAIVTGGASGIGRSICLQYAKEGATVVVADLQEASTAPDEKDLTTIQLIEKTYPERKTAYVHCDVSRDEDVRNAVKTTVEKFGRLDV